jgi:2-haloacid dehalogenase
MRLDTPEQRSLTPQVVIFDALGTLFDLEPVRASLVEVGAPPPTLEAWFERILHTALTLTSVGEFRPFQAIAKSALDTTFAQLELDTSRTAEVLESLKAVEPYDDAEAALERLADAGIRMVALTNGGAVQTEALLERAGLLDRFEHIFSVEEVGAYKPDARPYRHVLDQLEINAADATMVAAHAWDVIGARAAGLRAIWIRRLERRWPFPIPNRTGWWPRSSRRRTKQRPSPSTSSER